MLNRIRRALHALRDDTGTALVDSAVGVVVIAIAMSAIAATSFTVGTAVSETTATAAAQAYLRSAGSTASANPASLPTTPVAATVDADGRQLIMSSVRVDLADGRSLLRLAIPHDDSDCTTDLATAPRYEDCYVTEVTTGVAASSADPGYNAATLSLTVPGVDSQTGAAVAADAGVLASFTPAAGTQYVVGVKEPAAAGELIIRQGATVLVTIDYAPDNQGWFYGTLGTTDLVTAVTIELVGGGATVRGLTAYEVTS
jgi:hypothetical protein